MAHNNDLYAGKWHGKQYFFGFHSDLHVDPDDHEIGAHCDEKALVPLFKLIGADFVQTDCKGHPGYTSWFSHTPGASVAPGIVKEPLKEWRAASKKLGLPLHGHYSGIYDKAAGIKHPDWCIRDKSGSPVNSPGWYGPEGAGDKMCPRSPYLDELMIPQLIEVIDKFQIDGFWVDGDIWAIDLCYCDRCRQAFKEKTGIAEPPTDSSDPNWATWWNFTRESFEDYVTRYCDAVHQYKPGVLVASNWLQGFRSPGKPIVPTDWISGDALGNGEDPIGGVDVPRIDARFISTRGKPWDLMLWCFYGNLRDASTMKPVEVLQQQAATIVALGGNLQTCENPFIGLRSGQLVPWRVKHLAKLAEFAKQRQELCQNTSTVPQIAVLHSEHHFRSTQKNTNLFFGVDVAAARGAALNLLESQYGIDILDEWALLPSITDFPVIIAPEQDHMSDEMVMALKSYVKAGGKLLISGANAFDRFGGEFLGVTQGELAEGAIYNIQTGEESVQIKSALWRLVNVTTAKGLGPIGKTPLLNDQLLPNPAVTLNQVGKGKVAYIPFNIFREFDRTRYPLIRAFVQGVLQALVGALDVEVKAPHCVDVILRRKDGKLIVHLINQSDCKTHTIPRIGPIAVTIKLPKKPKRVERVFEDKELIWEYSDGGILKVVVPALYIHSAIVVE